MTSQAGAPEIRETEDLLRSVLDIGDDHDLILFQAEAIALLEAAVKALAFKGQAAGSVSTSIYGDEMAGWFRDAGCTTQVLDLSTASRAVELAEVAALLDSTPELGALAVVQGEALTGVVNPIDEIAELAANRGVCLLVDSVSSVGAEPFTPARWGRAISVLGAQKALGGPAGVSVAVIEKSLWPQLETNPQAPRNSFLSLLDIKHRWLDRGRLKFFGMTNSEEMAALRAALVAAQERSLTAIEATHQSAKTFARETVRKLSGLSLDVVLDDQASAVSTCFSVTDPALDRPRLLDLLAARDATEIHAAAGAHSLRWLHYDRWAEPEQLTKAATALAAVFAPTSG